MLLVAASLGGAAQDSDLAGRLDNLARQEGFRVTGMELLDSAAVPKGADSGPLEQRLRRLLTGYNFVLFHGSDGQISAVRILGVSRAGPGRLREATVPVTRRGAHYLVDAVLIGPTGLWANRWLIIDTGASTVVLPTSAIAQLGLRPSDLTAGTAETAGGKVPAQQGVLAAVRVGHAEAKNVPVTFIADAQLGQTALLGMSFLDHFRLTIDDAGQRVILSEK
jgi:aspartyl protease family protein